VENSVGECLFPSLNTPEAKALQESAPDLTVDKLRHLADLLSPLRSRSSTASSQSRPQQRDLLSAGSHTMSATSSFGYPLHHYSSSHEYSSDPGLKERGSNWNAVPIVSYRSAPTSPDSLPHVPLRAWGLTPTHSYFELYKPAVSPTRFMAMVTHN